MRVPTYESASEIGYFRQRIVRHEEGGHGAGVGQAGCVQANVTVGVFVKAVFGAAFGLVGTFANDEAGSDHGARVIYLLASIAASLVLTIYTRVPNKTAISIPESSLEDDAGNTDESSALINGQHNDSGSEDYDKCVYQSINYICMSAVLFSALGITLGSSSMIVETVNLFRDPGACPVLVDQQFWGVVAATALLNLLVNVYPFHILYRRSAVGQFSKAMARQCQTISHVLAGKSSFQSSGYEFYASLFATLAITIVGLVQHVWGVNFFQGKTLRRLGSSGWVNEPEVNVTCAWHDESGNKVNVTIAEKLGSNQRYFLDKAVDPLLVMFVSAVVIASISTQSLKFYEFVGSLRNGLGRSERVCTTLNKGVLIMLCSILDVTLNEFLPNFKGVVPHHFDPNAKNVTGLDTGQQALAYTIVMSNVFLYLAFNWFSAKPEIKKGNSGELTALVNDGPGLFSSHNTNGAQGVDQARAISTPM